MDKVVVFVEGQTELIFVREFLLKVFEYSVDIKCNALIAHELVYAEYDYPCSTSNKHYWIINVGNDETVLSEIIKRERILYKAGYQKIIGLRDMYSSKYKKYSKDIEANLITRFIDESNNSIKEKAINPSEITFLFSIMEIESWILGFDNILERIHPKLTYEYIKNEIGIDLDIDPETSIFHPAKSMDLILSAVGRNYDKSKHEINSFVSEIDKQDYNNLYKKLICSSYNQFYDCFN
jgi:hypothetical protein